MGAEKRQYPRLSTAIRAEYYSADRSEWSSIDILDLSAGGLGVVLEGPVDEFGDLTRVRFRLPESDRGIDLEAELVHTRTDDSRTLGGIRFRNPDSDTIAAIHHFVFDQLLEEATTASSEDPTGTDRVRYAEPIQIRYDHFTRFVEEATENLSPTGMFIRSQNPHPPGATFEFRFQLNDDYSLIQGKAEVVWIREVSNQDGLPSGMGVRFVELTDESYALIRKVTHQRVDGATPLATSDTPLESAFESDERTRPIRIQSKPRRGTNQLLEQLDRLRTKAKRREQEYRIQVERASSVLATLRGQVSGLEGQVSDLEGKLERERDSHQEQIEAVASNRDQLVQEFEQLQNERDRLAEDLATELTSTTDSAKESTENSAEDTSKESEDKLRRIADAEAARDDAETARDEEKARADALEEELKQAKEVIASAPAEIPESSGDELSALRSTIRGLESSLSASETARTQIRAANQEAHKNERTARKALHEVEAERDLLREQLADSRTHTAEEIAQHEAGDGVDVARERLEVLEKEHDVLTKRLRVAEENEEALQVRLRKLTDENKEFEDELTSLHAALEAAEERAEATLSEVDKVRADAETTIEAIHADYEKAGSQVSPDSDPEELKRSLAATHRQVDALKVESDERVRVVEAELEELRNSLSTSEAARRRITMQAAEASAQEESIREEMHELKRRQRKVGQEAAFSESSLKDVGAQLNAKQIELEAAISERDAFELEIQEQQEALSASRARSRKWPLRAAALVAAGTAAGILTGSVLLGGGDRQGSLPTPAEATQTPTTVVADANLTLPASADEVIGAGTESAQTQTTRSETEEAETEEAETEAATPTTVESVATADVSKPPIEESVRRWAAAWAGQDVDAYLASYDNEFLPPQDMTRDAWVSQRRDRIERPEWIRVSVDAMETTELPRDRARAVFVQTYETPTYQDQVTKTLELALRDGHWKIVQETSSS